MRILDAFARHPRNSVRGTQWDEMREIIMEVDLSDSNDLYSWALNIKEEFLVALTIIFIDAQTLKTSNIPTRRNTKVPKNIIAYVWRDERDKLPTRLNLRDKGIELEFFLCHVFSQIGEFVGHLFLNCNVFTPLWNLIARWWNIPAPSHDTVNENLHWVDSLKMTKEFS